MNNKFLLGYVSAGALLLSGAAMAQLSVGTDAITVDGANAAVFTAQGDGTNKYFVIRKDTDGDGGATASEDVLSVGSSGQLVLHGYIGNTFDASSSELLAIDASGNVVTVSPTVDTTLATSNLTQGAESRVYTLADQTLKFQDNATDTTTLFYIDGTNDRVGIGTNAPTAALDVSGTIKFSSLGAGNRETEDTTVPNTYFLTVDADGNLQELDIDKVQMIADATTSDLDGPVTITSQDTDPVTDQEAVLTVQNTVDGGTTHNPLFTVDSAGNTVTAGNASISGDASISGVVSVSGDTTLGGGLTLSGYGAGSNEALDTGNADAYVLTVDANGNVQELAVGDVTGQNLANTDLVQGAARTYTLADQTLNFQDNVTDTTSVLYVDGANDRVGIGTSSPTEALDVNGKGLFSSSVEAASFKITNVVDMGIFGTSGEETFFTKTFGKFMRFQISHADNSAESPSSANGFKFEFGTTPALTITDQAGADQRGFIGIRKNNATEALDVNGNILTSGSLTAASATISGDTTLSGLGTGTEVNLLAVEATGKVVTTPIVADTTLASADLTQDAARTYTLADQTINFQDNTTDTTPILYLDGANDRIGIGTSSPAEALDVSGNIEASGFAKAGTVTATNQLNIGGDAATDYNVTYAGGFLNFSRSSGGAFNNYIFGHNSGADPYTTLEIGSRATDGNARLMFNTEVGSSDTTNKHHAKITRYNNGGVNAGLLMIENTNTANNAVSADITIKSPGTITLDGTLNFTSVSAGDGEVLGIAADGTLVRTSTGANSGVYFSDERLKENVTTYTRGLDFIKALEPKQYKFTDESGLAKRKTDVGLIAQSVLELAPETVADVTVNGDDYYGIYYNDFIMALINATKELDSKNAMLEENNAALSAKLNAMQSELAAIKELVASIKP